MIKLCHSEAYNIIAFRFQIFVVESEIQLFCNGHHRKGWWEILMLSWVHPICCGPYEDECHLLMFVLVSVVILAPHCFCCLIVFSCSVFWLVCLCIPCCVNVSWCLTMHHCHYIQALLFVSQIFSNSIFSWFRSLPFTQNKDIVDDCLQYVQDIVLNSFTFSFTFTCMAFGRRLYPKWLPEVLWIVYK